MRSDWLEDDLLYAFRTNIVVAASAGTGKTHRLTCLYVLLTLGLTSSGKRDEVTPKEPVSPSRIVATTFSRAAAHELRTRVEHHLTEIAERGLEPTLAFYEPIERRRRVLISAPSSDEIQKRAKQALLELPLARIDTLHGLANRILALDSSALGIHSGYRVLEEDESDYLSTVAVEEVLTEWLSDRVRAPTARSLLQLASGSPTLLSRHIGRLSDRLDEGAYSLGQILLHDHLADARTLKEQLTQHISDCEKDEASTLREAARLSLQALLRPPLASRLIARESLVPLYDLLVRKKSRSKRSPSDEAFYEFRDTLSGNTHAEMAERCLAFLWEAPMLSEKEEQVLTFVAEARTRIAHAKSRARGLGFGDLLRAAKSRLMTDTRIAEKLRESIEALLVDEFQDTSRIQRDLIYLLRKKNADQALPGEPPRAAELLGHGLFLVGDRKQSIYGFRGVDVSIFADVCVELAGNTAISALQLKARVKGGSPSASFIALRESRRSASRILDFVNAFSERDFKPTSGELRSFEMLYSQAETLKPPEGSSPGGKVVFIRDDGSSPGTSSALLRESTGALREAFIAAHYLEARVRHEKAPFGWRDTAILSRRRSSIPFLELALSELNIPYVLAGRALFDTREVRDLVALLRLIIDPRDRLALATVLRSPIVGISDAGLVALSAKGKGLAVSLLGRTSRADLDDAAVPNTRELHKLSASDRHRLEAFQKSFASFRSTALRLECQAAVRQAISHFGMDRVLSCLPRASLRIGNVDRIAELAAKRPNTLSGFVRWLERRMRDESDEAEAAAFSEEDDAVRLTTIHASKGLDFPLVIVVDLNASPRASTQALDLTYKGEEPCLLLRHFGSKPHRIADEEALGVSLPLSVPLSTALHREAFVEARAREEAERRRITYVALTRAKRELVLVGPAGKAQRGSAYQTLEAGIESSAFENCLEVRTAQELLTLASSNGLQNAERKATNAQPLPSLAPIPFAPQGRRRLRIATTPLSLFSDCPRRFQLRSLLGLDEQAPEAPQLSLFAPPEATPIAKDLDTDPRAKGRAMHRVLERWPLEAWGQKVSLAEIERVLDQETLTDVSERARIARGIQKFLESEYGKSCSLSNTRVLREETFVLSLAKSGEKELSLALRGTIDLLTIRDDSLDVLDYKLSSAKSDLSSYEFQLRSYALAAHRRFPGRRVRAGIIFLGDASEIVFLRTGEETVLSDEDHAAFAAELIRLGDALDVARKTNTFLRVEPDRCRRLRCGFLKACYSEVTRE